MGCDLPLSLSNEISLNLVSHIIARKRLVSDTAEQIKRRSKHRIQQPATPLHIHFAEHHLLALRGSYLRPEGIHHQPGQQHEVQKHQGA